MKHGIEREYTSGQMTRDLILLGGSIFVSGAGFGGAVLSSLAATCSWTVGTPSLIIAIVGGLGAWASALHIYDGVNGKE